MLVIIIYSLCSCRSDGMTKSEDRIEKKRACSVCYEAWRSSPVPVTLFLRVHSAPIAWEYLTDTCFVSSYSLYSSLSRKPSYLRITETDGPSVCLSGTRDTRYEFIRKLIIALFNVCKTFIISHINIYFVFLIKPKIHRLSSLKSWPNVSYLFPVFALSSHHIFSTLTQSGLSCSPVW